METPTYLKKLNLKKDGRLFGFGTSPEADWKIIFLSALIFAIILIIFNIFIFIQIRQGEIFTVEQSPGAEEKLLDPDLLKQTVIYYQNKSLEFEKIKNQ